MACKYIKMDKKKRKEILFIQERKNIFWLQNSNVRWERGKRDRNCYCLVDCSCTGWEECWWVWFWWAGL